MRDGTTEVEVEHAGLDPCQPLLGVDVEDVVELGGDDDERIAHRGGTAREARTAPPRHERAVVTCGDPHRFGDLPRVARKAHGRGVAGRDPSVAGVERELERLGTRSILAEGGTEVCEHRIRTVDTADITT